MISYAYGCLLILRGAVAPVVRVWWRGAPPNEREIRVGNSSGKFEREIRAGNSSGKFEREIRAANSSDKFERQIRAANSKA